MDQFAPYYHVSLDLSSREKNQTRRERRRVEEKTKLVPKIRETNVNRQFVFAWVVLFL